MRTAIVHLYTHIVAIASRRIALRYMHNLTFNII